MEKNNNINKEDTVSDKNNNGNKENETNSNKTNNNTNKTNNTGGGIGTLKKCENVKSVLTNEEAGKKIASLMGASVGTGKYCDKLAPESVAALTNDGTCAIELLLLIEPSHVFIM